MQGFGPHLVMDAWGCSSRKLTDLSGLFKLLDEFPEQIGMTKIMPPYVFSHGEKGKPDYGLSGFVLIAESHISIHTFPGERRMVLDIFSCEQFDVTQALDHLVKYFQPEEFTHKLLERGHEFPRRIDLSRAVVEAHRNGVNGRSAVAVAATGTEGGR